VTLRPRLLFLSQTLPYPPDGGVKIRTFHVLRLLATAFDVTALCFFRWKGGRAEQDIAGALQALNGLAHVEAFPIPQEHHRGRFLWDHLRSALTRRTYTVYAYESAAFRSRVTALLHEQSFALAHIDSLDLSGYLPLLRGLPVVCVHHDAQSALLQRRAEQEEAGWRRAYVRYQAALMAREERRVCADVELNVTVSDVDRATLGQRAPGGRFVVVPNGVDVEAFRPGEGRDDSIVFVGGTTWFPNHDAMAYFCDAILPLIRGLGEPAPVRWVGRATEAERQGYRDRYGVELTGYVPDVRPYVRDAGCYVVPLRIGGGTRIKILDAWAMGKAVVSTSIGCEGLAAVDGENILIRDTPAAFAAAVCDILRDTERRRRLGRAARETVEQRYGWEVIGAAMVQTYCELLRPQPVPAAVVHA
jgi:glycosyltransferase involved in cell wall biosynthesis